MIRSRNHILDAGIFFCTRQHHLLCPAFFFAVLIILILSSIPVFAQTTVRLEGRVFDAVDGHPIENAYINLESTGFATQTDSRGYYHLEHLPTGLYAINVTAEGYQSPPDLTVEIRDDITAVHNIHLQRLLYQFESLIVHGKRQRPTVSGDVRIISREDIARFNEQTIAAVLDDIEGVFIQESDKSGGQAAISIRGCDPKHVLVLVDGHRINAAGTGVADLNLVPLEMVESIEVYPGGQSATFGSDALGGVVNIKTHAAASGGPQFDLNSEVAQWKSRRFSITALDIFPDNRMATKMAYTYRASNGDFPVTYVIDGQPVKLDDTKSTRLNARSLSESYFASLKYQLDAVSSLSATGHILEAENGLPGAATRPDTTAHKIDYRALFTASYSRHFDPGRKLSVDAGFSRFRQHFTNTDHPSPAYRYETRYINDLARFDARLVNTLPLNIETTSGFELQRSILYHDDLHISQNSLGRVVRDNLGVHVTARRMQPLPAELLGAELTIMSSLRYDHTATSHDDPASPDHRHDQQFTYRIGFAVTRGEAFRLTVRGGYGQAYRLPELNALFWKTDSRAAGNPNLLPESSEDSNIEAEIAIDGPVRFSGHITYFHSHVQNLILWKPSSPSGIFKPVNEEAAQVTGHTEAIRMDLFDGDLSLRYQNTVTVPLNRGQAHYGLDLTHRPRYVTTIAASGKLWKFFADYDIRLVARRFANDANTRYYDHYRIDNLRIGAEHEFGHITARLSYRADNLQNEAYTLINQHPMPGRHWGINAQLSYTW